MRPYANTEMQTKADNPVQPCHVLMVEDDPSVIEAVRERLGRENIIVHHTSSIERGKAILDSGRHMDAIVLDLCLPDGSGLELARYCRKSGIDTPIIMVTAVDGVDDRVKGLSVGADDYLCKPFSVDELYARLKAVLRRARPAHTHLLTYCDIELNLVTRRVRRRDKEAELSTRELDLLAYFMCHPEEPLTQKQIVQDVWGDTEYYEVGVLRVYTNYLRNKLGKPQIIHTLRGIGYILSELDPEETGAGRGFSDT